MIAALLLALACALGGAAITYLYDSRATLGARLAAGYVLGSCVAGYAGYALASVFGMGAASLIGAGLIAAAPLLLLSRPALRARALTDLRAAVRPPDRLSRRRLLYWAVFDALALLFVGLFRGTFYRQDGALWTNNHNNFGDLPFHLGIIQGFAVGDGFPPQHPEYAGIRLTYPFLVDFIAAQYAAAGADLTGALLLQNVLLGLCLLALLLRAGVLFTRRVGAALLAPILVVFSGGLGFLLAWQDWRMSGLGPRAFLSSVPHDYTTWAEQGLRWGNTMMALLTTQRGLLIAIPLFLITATLWWQTLQHARTEPRPLRRTLAAGAVMGLVPLVHGHTFLTLILVGGPLALWDLWRTPADRRGARFAAWAAGFGLAFVLAAPQALLLASGSAAQGGAFFGWQPGWDKGPDRAALPFWWLNLGAFLPLLLVALLWRAGRAGAPVPPRLLRFYAPFALCFVVPNLWRLAPWIWDNIKVLLYWHLASAWLIAALLPVWWGRRRRGIPFPLLSARRAGVAALVAALTLSGGLDVLRIARGQARWSPLYAADTLAFADAVRGATRPGDVILCTPRHDSPILLTGRPELMGYEGHLWSHGLAFEGRRADVRAMLGGGPDAAALLTRYGVRYVAVGPPERDLPEYPTGRTFWSAYPVAARAGGYTLYAVR